RGAAVGQRPLEVPPDDVAHEIPADRCEVRLGRSGDHRDVSGECEPDDRGRRRPAPPGEDERRARKTDNKEEASGHRGAGYPARRDEWSGPRTPRGPDRETATSAGE